MEENSLIPASQLNVAVLFSDKIDDILSEIERLAMSHVPNMETAQGRKDIASMAYKVSRSKTIIENFGKEANAERKKETDRVNGYRKKARDFLDPLRDRVRQPLTEWELEQEKIKAEEKRMEEKRIQEWIDELKSYDFTMEFFTLATMDDEAYLALLRTVKSTFEANQDAIAEEARIEQERKEKEEADRKAENERLAKQKAEQDAEAARLQKIADDLKAQQDKIDAVNREAERQKELEAAKKEAAELAAKEELERIQREAQARINLEASQKAEKARQEALKPDKEKLIAWANELLEIVTPDLKSDIANDLAGKAQAYIYSTAKGLIQKAKEL